MRSLLLVLFMFMLVACGGTTPTVLPSTSVPVSSTPSPHPPALAPTETTATPLPNPPVLAPTGTTATQSLPVAPAPSATTAPLPTAAESSGIPNPQAYAWQPVATDLDMPIGIYNAGDSSNRLFIIEQKGKIRILKDGLLLTTPFLDITDRVGSNGSERGLLGFAFHPKYAQNGNFYVNYTDKAGNTVIARYSVSKDDPNQADHNSENRLLHIQQPFPNHNGGEVVFGPDGFLYLGLGDGGSGGDPYENGQSLNTLLGKILRIDVDQGQPYAIPSDNPFASGGGKPEIWAYGLRNPWRFSFDRQTGDLYIGDVGQDQWEEIDFLPAGTPGGTNFAWNYFEGLHPYSGQTPPSGTVIVDPVAEYSHDLGCSVTGGFVYRGQALPEWQGIYLYGDYCSGLVWGLYRTAQGDWQSSQVFDSLGPITSFGEDEAGEIYMAIHSGTIYRLEK
jgi:glucose/arabinose dehydrogenase